MDTNKKSSGTAVAILLIGSALTATLCATIPAVAGAAETETKTVRSSGGRVSERGAAPTRDRSTFVESATFTTQRAAPAVKGDSTTAAAVIEEGWVYDADVELFDDYDGDGFYSFMRVSFDADSIYDAHWMYARLFVTLDGVNWDEYHITEDFLIEGTTPDDAYEVETELLSGFEPGLYDVLIELYDADFGYFLGEYGPAQSSAFSLLPLEDVDRDTPPVVIIEDHGGGGATGLPALAGLGLLVALARRARRRRLRVVQPEG